MEIGSLYSDYLTSTATKASNLEKTIQGTSARSTDDDLLEACKEFETYFYEQVFKEMEKALVPDDGESDTNDTLVDYYKEQLITQYSKSITEQGGTNSLSQQLYEQMKRNNAVTLTQSSAVSETESASETEVITAAESGLTATASQTETETESAAESAASVAPAASVTES